LGIICHPADSLTILEELILRRVEYRKYRAIKWTHPVRVTLVYLLREVKELSLQTLIATPNLLKTVCSVRHNIKVIIS
jgi:hypothetical protein